MVSRDSQSSHHEDKAVDDSNESHPSVILPDASFLAFAEFEQVGFDLVITNAEGEVFVVHDYFSFDPPPNLLLETGAGLSPEMVAHLLHQSFEGGMFAGPASATAPVVIGTVKLKLGDVEVERDGEWIKLNRGDELLLGDQIKTGTRGFIRADMLDGTRFTLGKNGRAQLTEFVYEPEADKGSFGAMVLAGGFKYKSGLIGQLGSSKLKAHSQISTPTAIIGIRGSEGEGNVDPLTGETTFIHKSGYLVVTDLNGDNEVVLEQPGHCLLYTSPSPRDRG